jgi:hypothetical protein
MNHDEHYARRYHWLSETMPSFISEPHAAIACDHKNAVLNLVAQEGDAHRQAITSLSREHPERMLREIQPLLKSPALPLFDGLEQMDKSPSDLRLTRRHTIGLEHIHPLALKKVLIKTYESQATDFEALLGEPGIGPQALRSLSLIAEVVYNAKASRRDPAAYSFAHGGKDGHPYEVNRPLYDANIERLRQTIEAAKIGASDKTKALKSLASFTARLN